MKSQALQEFVREIFNNEKTRQQFESNPDSVLARFNLTEQEKKSVLNTYAKLGLVTGDSQQLGATLDPTLYWF